MKIILFGLCFLVLLGSAAFSQTDHYGLPAGAQVIEVQPLQSMKHPHRALVLWMQSPLKVPRDNPDDPYTCPEYTRGSHYRGATRVSLVDPQTKKIINTIKILNSEGDDTFDIPYRIESGLYYHVSGVPKGKEGKPTIVWLKTTTATARPGNLPCSMPSPAWDCPLRLIGYREAQDRVIQYPVDLTVISGNQKSTRTILWVDYLFSKRPGRPAIGNMPSITGGEPGPWIPTRSATCRKPRSSPAV